MDVKFPELAKDDEVKVAELAPEQRIIYDTAKILSKE